MPGPGDRVAVVVPVPAAEALVSTWRARFDASAAEGMPAHITALYPFLPQHRLSDAVLGRLREICAAVPALDIAFQHVRRFPDVVYLAPEPDRELRALTIAIARQWPEAPPYAGAFDEVVPHLTVAHHAGPAEAAHVEAQLRAGLPCRARLTEACLYVFDGARWRARERLPFAAVSS